MEDILNNSFALIIPSIQIILEFAVDVVFQKEKNKIVISLILLGIIISVINFIFQLVDKKEKNTKFLNKVMILLFLLLQFKNKSTFHL
jgi:ABC-type transport system involved in cytochrome c biogenesis permease component